MRTLQLFPFRVLDAGTILLHPQQQIGALVRLLGAIAEAGASHDFKALVGLVMVADGLKQ
jgi:hypothetical protein